MRQIDRNYFDLPIVCLPDVLDAAGPACAERQAAERYEG